MAESDDLYLEVVALRAKVDDLSASTQSLLRLSGAELKTELLEYLSSDAVAREVFLLCDGERSQSEILASIAARSFPGGSPAGISRRIDTLVHDKNLLVKSGRKGRSAVYRHTHMANTLQIVRGLVGR